MNPLEIKTLPAVPMPDDVIDRVAKEVAANVADHIEFMYPEAAQAVSWGSTRRSIQGVVRNLLNEAGRGAEAGRIEAVLTEQRERRLRYRNLVAAHRQERDLDHC